MAHSPIAFALSVRAHDGKQFFQFREVRLCIKDCLVSSYVKQVFGSKQGKLSLKPRMRARFNSFVGSF